MALGSNDLLPSGSPFSLNLKGRLGIMERMLEVGNLSSILKRYSRLVKFCIVGGSGTVVGLGVLYLFTDVVGLYYLASNAIAFVCSVSNNYTWNSLWTFQDRKASPIGYLRYVGTSLAGLGVNMTVLWFFTSIIGVWYMLSAVVAVICAFLVNYTLSKRFVWIGGKSR